MTRSKKVHNIMSNFRENASIISKLSVEDIYHIFNIFYKYIIDLESINYRLDKKLNKIKNDSISLRKYLSILGKLGIIKGSEGFNFMNNKHDHKIKNKFKKTIKEN